MTSRSSKELNLQYFQSDKLTSLMLSAVLSSDQLRYVRNTQSLLSLCEMTIDTDFFAVGRYFDSIFLNGLHPKTLIVFPQPCFFRQILNILRAKISTSTVFPGCWLPYSLCYMLTAILSMLYAICWLPYCLCYMLYAICWLPYCLCYMLYAFCYIVYAICWLPYCLCYTLYLFIA